MPQSLTWAGGARVCRRNCALVLAAGLAACASSPAQQAPAQQAPAQQAPLPQTAGPAAEENAAFWFASGAATAAARRQGLPPARNLILFVGDGMSLTTVAAARILAGQQAGGHGEENLLSFEQFPATALSKTYNTDSQTPDSAGTATAMLSGVKTRRGVIGLHQQARRGDCTAAQDAVVPTLIELAEEAGLATGIVTTTRVTHATPAAAYAHAAERDWESDAAMPAAALAAGCRDIARQLVEFAYGDGPEVVLGGGRAAFLPAGASDPEYPGVRGTRRDRDLVELWKQRHAGGAFVWNAQQFAALDAAASGPVLGLFEPSHLQFEHDRARDAAGEPSLAEMTLFAIRRLQSASADGYVLLVEGGRIDHAHHAGNAYRALTDTIALSQAVQAAVENTSRADTLIVVTADHSHTLSFAGYPQRGNPILGLVTGSADDADDADDADRPELQRDLLGLPYTTLSYANGPGYTGESDGQPEGAKRYPHQTKHYQPMRHGRPDLGRVDTQAPDYLQEALVPLDIETHGGDDVSVYALGPGSAGFRGVLEQNVIFHLLAQAQPRIVRALCAHGACDGQSRPLRLPAAGVTR